MEDWLEYKLILEWQLIGITSWPRSVYPIQLFPAVWLEATKTFFKKKHPWSVCPHNFLTLTEHLSSIHQFRLKINSPAIGFFTLAANNAALDWPTAPWCYSKVNPCQHYTSVSKYVNKPSALQEEEWPFISSCTESW